MLKSVEATEEAILTSSLVHRVALPDSRDAGEPLPTIVLVHGRAGDANVMWTFGRTIPAPLPLIVAPQAPIADPIGGFSWWVLDGTSKRAPEAVDLEAALAPLTRFLDSLPQLYGADPERMIALGFSQGAATLSSLSLKEPERFRAVGLLAGFIPNVARTAYGDRPSERLPHYFIAHGTADTVLPVEHGRAARDYLVGRGAEVTYVEDDTGHKVGSTGMKALARWLGVECLAL